MLRRQALETWLISLLGIPFAACNSHASSKSQPPAQAAPGEGPSGTSSSGGAGNASGTTAAIHPANPPLPVVATGFGFLTATDVVIPSAIDTATAAQVTSQLTGWDTLAGDTAPSAAPAPSDGADASADCFTAAVAATPIKGTDTSLTIEYKGDLADCQTKAGTTSTYAPKYSTFAVHYLQVIGCAKGGLGKAIGKTQAQLGSVDFGCTAGVSTEIRELQVLAKSTFSTANASGPALSGHSTLSMVTYHAMADLSPCSKTLANGTETLKSGCVDVDTVVTTTALAATPPVVTVTYKKAAGSEVVKSSDSATIWPSSGTLQLTLANWTGTLVYSGPKAAPTYALKDPSGAAIKGALPAPGASLVGVAGSAGIIQRGLSQMEPK